jgi:hypothetical protein
LEKDWTIRGHFRFLENFEIFLFGMKMNNTKYALTEGIREKWEK